MGGEEDTRGDVGEDSRLTGPVEVDAMAQEEGRNAVTSKWFSKGAQSFEEGWGKEWILAGALVPHVRQGGQV